ncbi:BlaI/MecI/CopY family transcriptional regulator [Flavivirga eckloniae]|uniref:Penicillinase repressor n=1 Tax=Flavivirga eckloniae TaxID=1803846 RepID=A0A2K9PV47_9FLAO|nr:BlaI/MecI/CopY family transcriptional regulator [Flavivirga eckloniae]AUP80933.1 penicillinase repressor [Flavivirga eckloniae]
MKLSRKEEELINIIWRLGDAYMKDLLNAYPEPKPASTTVSTLLKRLINKGVISYRIHGNSRQYYGLINKTEYSSFNLKNMIGTFFQGSSSRFASFFANNMKLTKEELTELRNIIDEKIDNLEK